LAFVASAILFAPLASWIAVQRVRSWPLWFLFGIALGPVAALLLLAAPPGRCPACGNRSVGWPRRCANCGLAFSAVPLDATIPMTPDGLPVEGVFAQLDSPGLLGVGGPGESIVVAAAAASGTSYSPARLTVPDRGPDRGTERPMVAVGPGRDAASLARSATTLGRRPTDEPGPAAKPAAQRRPSSGTLAILGSGIFIGGSEPLQVGSRYLIARVGSELHILGPVHLSPAAVAARLPLSNVQPTVVADRVLISPAKPGRGADVAFGSVMLERDVDLVRDLKSPRRSRSTASASS
jgi:hypothetical protein